MDAWFYRYALDVPTYDKKKLIYLNFWVKYVFDLYKYVKFLC